MIRMKKYILKIKNNDAIEEKEFYNEADAIQELEGYKKDKIDDYTYIALIDVSKNLVLRILYFTSKDCLDLKDGSFIKLKKENLLIMMFMRFLKKIFQKIMGRFMQSN